MKTWPSSGRRVPAASCALAKAMPKLSPIPMTSPVERISGPSTVSTPGKRLKGSTASFTDTYVGYRRRDRDDARIDELDQGLSHHDAHRDLRECDAGRFGDEGHRALGARIRLEDVDLLVLDRVLDVDESHDAERLGDLAGVRVQWSRAPLRSASGAAARTPSRHECTPASSTCSITPATKISPSTSRTASTSTSIGVFEETVDQDRPALGDATLARERAVRDS